MDDARLHELEAQIARQQAVLVEQQNAVRRQQERVDALRRELEQLRALLGSESRSGEDQAHLPL